MKIVPEVLCDRRERNDSRADNAWKALNEHISFNMISFPDRLRYGHNTNKYLDC